MFTRFLLTVYVVWKEVKGGGLSLKVIARY